MDSAQWRTYGRTIETVSISFDGCGVGVWEALQCFGVAVTSLSLWRRAPSLLLVLLVFSQVQLLYISTPNIFVLCWS